VDDEPNVLQAFERQFRRRFELQTAQGPEKGLEVLASSGAFAVVVSDLRMPGMDGIEFLGLVRARWPNTVRVMLTGQADLTDAIAAVNRGNIFQFLTKPCPTEMLGRTLEAALEQHRLVTAERELLEQTLRGSIGMMSEILSLVNPIAFSRAERVRRYVVHIAQRLSLAGQWQYELAAMLSQIGCVAVPQAVLEKYYDAQILTPDEQDILSSQFRTGAKLLARIPRLEEVAHMVECQSGPPPGGWPSATVETGSRLLRVTLDFDDLVAHGADPATALERMATSRKYQAEFLKALAQVQVEHAKREVMLLPVAKLKAGMITNCNVQAKTGLMIMGTGQEITESALARLQAFSTRVGIVEPISVQVPTAGHTVGVTGD